MEINSETIVAIIAVVVALVSLGVSIWFGQDARERDFLYKSYDRLGELRVVVRQNVENTAKRLDDAKRASSPAEATKLMIKYKLETVDEVTRAQWAIELHQFALDKATLDALNGHVKDVHKRYEEWDKAANAQKATNEHALAYGEALDAFWKLMTKAVAALMAEVARRLRR